MSTEPKQWLLAAYEPVSPFSLRMSQMTSKGGKTLVVPTPYATKMALIDACFRRESGPTAQAVAIHIFDLVKSRTICFRPPPHGIVQNTFVKVLDAERDGERPFKQTIAYREFVVFSGGSLEVALDVSGFQEPDVKLIESLFWHINSIGKRGSFWQCTSVTAISGALGSGFTASISGGLSHPESFALVQHLDDFGEDLCNAADGFDRISTYGERGITLGKHRVLTSSAIPYRRRSAAKRFTWYERVV